MVDGQAGWEQAAADEVGRSITADLAYELKPSPKNQWGLKIYRRRE